MEYRQTFINQYLHIKVYTNSKSIYKLIENFLDFNSMHSSNPKIKIDFYLNETNHKSPDNESKFLYQSRLDKNKNLLSSIGNRIVTVAANPKTGIVKATIVNYKESHKERLLDLVFTKSLHFILAYHNLFFLHASAVYKGRDCILIIGNQHSGKSTLALILSQNGFNILTDDDCFVKLVGNRTVLFPFPTKMGLNDKILKKYPQLNKHTLRNYRYGGKQRISLNSLSSNSNNTKALRCKMIIFPSYKAERNVYLKEIPKEKALDRLIKEYPIIYKDKGYQRMFWTLYNLISKAKSFELIYNDAKLDEIPKIINKFF